MLTEMLNSDPGQQSQRTIQVKQNTSQLILPGAGQKSS